MRGEGKKSLGFWGAALGGGAVLACGVVLLVFLVLPSASAKEAALGESLQAALAAQPPQSVLRRTLQQRALLARQTVEQLYGECVKGVENLGQKLEQWGRQFADWTAKAEQ